MFVSEGQVFHYGNTKLGLALLVALCSLVLREPENVWPMPSEFSFKEAGVAHPLQPQWASRADVVEKAG